MTHSQIYNRVYRYKIAKLSIFNVEFKRMVHTAKDASEAHKYAMSVLNRYCKIPKQA